jgi:c-di-GMP-related signal transduction protein
MPELVARQPIFTRGESVYGYELLFRSSPENFFNGKDREAATRAVADQLITLGNSLTKGRMAFINCTAQFLTGDYLKFLPPANTAIEILETVEPDAEVLSACRKLKQAGYVIALDDFVMAEKFIPFLELADIVKIDFVATSSSERDLLMKDLASRGIPALGEKLETRETFRQALGEGCQYFQGHFFCKPQMITGKRLPASKLNSLRILQIVTGPMADWGELELAVTHEVSVCYKLLRYVNSPLLGLRSEIKSVRHALALLGQDEVRKLVTLAVALSVADDKPPELMATALVRARCCELVGAALGGGLRGLSKSACFLMGMFSIMDALLGLSMREILRQTALPPEVRGALQGEPNVIRSLCDLVLAYERGNWVAFNQYSARLDLQESLMSTIYFEALEWANDVFNLSAPSDEESGENDPGVEQRAATLGG